MALMAGMGGEGFRALYGEDARSNGGVVHVRAYIRNGHTVAAHTRGAPPRGEGGGDDLSSRGERPELPDHAAPIRRQGWAVTRRNLLDDALTPVMARKPEGGAIGERRGVIGQGGGGGLPRLPAPGGSSPTPAAPAAQPGQSLRDMLAPGGEPIGVRMGRARPNVRTLPGGQPAAEAMLNRMLQGRNFVETTPPGFRGACIASMMAPC